MRWPTNAGGEHPDTTDTTTSKRSWEAQIRRIRRDGRRLGASGSAFSDALEDELCAELVTRLNYETTVSRIEHDLCDQLNKLQRECDDAGSDDESITACIDRDLGDLNSGHLGCEPIGFVASPVETTRST